MLKGMQKGILMFFKYFVENIEHVRTRLNLVGGNCRKAECYKT